MSLTPTDVKLEEGGYEDGEGIYPTYTYYNLSILFEEIPNAWFKYDTGIGMLTLEKALPLYEELKEKIRLYGVKERV